VALTAGARLGPYEITAQIGVGGMGEVWCATDTNLGRQVAIKILPDAFAQDPDRLARFEREARTLASLNHPNIAIIHGLVTALVSERQFRWETVDENNSGDPLELFSSLSWSMKNLHRPLLRLHIVQGSVCATADWQLDRRRPCAERIGADPRSCPRCWRLKLPNTSELWSRCFPQV